MSNSSMPLTLHLRWVNPESVYEKYMKGHFSELSGDSIIAIGKTGIMKKEYDSNYSSNIFSISCKDGTNVVVLTSNSCFFERGDDKIRCRWCCSDIEDPVLIPSELETYLMETEGGAKEVTVCHGNVATCDFNCALAYAISNTGIGHQASHNLNLMFSKLYPNCKLVQAGDPGLLKINGGSMSYNQYKSGDVYSSLPGILKSPTRNMISKR